MQVFLVAILICVFASTAFSQKNSNVASRRVDDALAGLNEGTRKRVLAMQQAGMPHDAIAKKIKYEVGNPGIAKRMMEKINTEETKSKWQHKQKQKFTGKESIMKQKVNSFKKKNRARAREEL